MRAAVLALSGKSAVRDDGYLTATKTNDGAGLVPDADIGNRFRFSRRKQSLLGADQLAGGLVALPDGQLVFGKILSFRHLKI